MDASNTIVFCSWISEIVLEWLHEGCDSDLSADFLHFGASDFPSKNPFKKCFKIVFFSLWRRDPVLELQFPTPLRVVLLCFATQSLRVSADRIVMAASRLLRAVAAFVILLSFAAGSRKSYWSGCMKAATVICQQIFSSLALVIFLLKILLKSASKSSFFRSGVEIHPVLELQFPTPLRVVLLCFATQSLRVSADRIVMAASRLLRAVAAFVILLSFAARLRKSYWSGCMKAATVICQQIFSILSH